jgi:hypothetical protein
MILTRIWIQTSDIEPDIQIRNKIAIHPSIVNFYEEHLGGPLEGVEEPMTALYLVTQEIIVVLASFNEIKKQMSSFYDQQGKSGLFNNN